MLSLYEPQQIVAYVMPRAFKICQLTHLPVAKGAALALLWGRFSVEPHVIVSDQLLAAFEDVDERNRTVRPDDRRSRVDLNHR